MNSEGWPLRSLGVCGVSFASRYAEPANRNQGAGVSARCTRVESGRGSVWALIATSVVLADDVDILVGRMRDNIDLGVPDEKVRHDVAHRELHGCDCRGAADGTGRFTQAMADDGLSQLGLAQHRRRVAIEFL